MNALFGRRDSALFFVDFVMQVTSESTHDRCELVVKLGGVGETTANNQRRSRLVDQNRVDLINDAVRMTTLYLGSTAHGHVVAQIVEAELVVRAVSDVGAVLGPLVGWVVVTRDDQANIETHELVNLPHPLGVSLCEIVIHRDLVHATAG